jgi:hypothetical protein
MGSTASLTITVLGIAKLAYFNSRKKTTTLKFSTKRELRPITLREEKKGEQLRTEGPYG